MLASAFFADALSTANMFKASTLPWVESVVYGIGLTSMALYTWSAAHANITLALFLAATVMAVTQIVFFWMHLRTADRPTY
jgi:predicted signal transduction protein with EAL and GGDEF domain